MRIHRLRLEHVKAVTATELTFPEAGVVVIEGPNEVGKSTLLEALDRLLDPKARASSKAASIVSMQPVGQDVGPYVEAELSIGTYRLIFAKRWLKQPATTLQILQPTPEQLTGQDAQARMNTILDQCLDRTLFDALRLAQAGSPGTIALGNSAVLEAALDAAAGADLHADEGSALLEKVEREYLRYYTAGRGRATGELAEAQTAVTEAEQWHEQAEHDVREVEELFRRRAAVAQDLANSEQLSSAAAAEVQSAAAALAEVVELRADEKVEATFAVATEESHRRALGEVRTRQGLALEVVTRSAEVEQRRQETEQLQTVRDQRTRELAAREEDLARANGDWARAQNEAGDAAAELAYVRSQADLTALADRIEVAETLTRAVQQSRAEVEASEMTATVLEELRRSDAALSLAQARVEASATAVRVSAPGPGHSIQITEESHAFDPGLQVIERLVTRDVSLLVDSRVRVEIRPDTQARERLERRDVLRDVLAERLKQLGLGDLLEAEREGERRAEAVSRTTTLERDLAEALQGHKLVDLCHAHAVQTVEMAAALGPSLSGTSETAQNSVGAGPGAAPKAQRSGSLQRAEQRSEATRRALPQVNQIRDGAQQAADAARECHAQAGAALEVMQAKHGSAETEQTRGSALLAGARVIDSDAELHEQVRHVEALVGQAQARLHATRTALAAQDALAREDVASQAGADLSRARAHLQLVREQFFEIKGRLEQVTAEGRQEAYERADQQLDDARRRHAAVARRATAAARLHTTLQHHRDRAHQSYAEPYARQIERLGQQIYGDSFGVIVSQDLVITHRQLHGDVVPFKSLSGGAKEQLGMVARLAVAALVAEDQSVPVVVDDALGYTDPQRLQRLGAVLAHGAGCSQLLLLTCTPERYADIPGAHTIWMSA